MGSEVTSPFSLPFPTFWFFQLAEQLWKPGAIQLPEIPPALLGITNPVTEPDWILGVFSIHFSAKSDTSAQVPWVHTACCWTLFRSYRRARIVCTQAFLTKVTRIWQQPLSQAGKLLQPILHRKSGETFAYNEDQQLFQGSYCNPTGAAPCQLRAGYEPP